MSSVPPASVPAYIGLGSNLQEPAQQILRACAELAALPHLELRARSPLYRSPPMGPADQPAYINAVLAIATTLAPLALLTQLHAIEDAHQRVRTIRWGPRTLDLDLLVYDNVQLDTPELTLPHPGIAPRNFVLYPLADVAPDLLIPGLGHIQQLLAQCPAAGLERIEP